MIFNKELQKAISLSRNKITKGAFLDQVNRLLDMLTCKACLKQHNHNELLFLLSATRGLMNYQTHWLDPQIDELLSREV